MPVRKQRHFSDDGVCYKLHGISLLQVSVFMPTVALIPYTFSQVELYFI